ncbi:MAG: hypothetical protein ABI391_00105 [Hyphomicrobiaceae bacterium]
MLTVGSPLSGALAALSALAPGHVQAHVGASAASGHAGNALTGASRMRLSSSASDALLKFSDYATGAKGAASPTTVLIEPARTDQGAAHPSGIPADKVAWLDSLGADSWAVREPPQMDDAAFKTQVLDGLFRNGSAKLAGFNEALGNGTLTVDRSADVPELGYKSFQVTLYKEGKECGGAGFSVCNTDHWMEMRASGIYAGTGSVDGNDYVVTWPMPYESASASMDPGTYAAA